MDISHLGGLCSTEIQCPFCFERISLAIDLGGGARQEFVYDCEVCCRPIAVSAVLEGSELDVQAERAQD